MKRIYLVAVVVLILGALVFAYSQAPRSTSRTAPTASQAQQTANKVLVKELPKSLQGIVLENGAFKPMPGYKFVPQSKNTLKVGLRAGGVVGGGGTGPSPKSNAAAPISISISVWFGRASKGCRGWGICKITIGKVTEARTGEAELSTAGNGKLQLTLLHKAPEAGRTLFVDEDIPLSQEIAEKLGFRSATIRRGQYSFGRSKSVLNARLTR
jgi:hypothetical protein